MENNIVYKVGDCLVHKETREVLKVIGIIEWADGYFYYDVERLDRDGRWHTVFKVYNIQYLHNSFVSSKSAQVLYGK